MTMTEAEVEKLMAEVGEVDWTDPVVVAFMKRSLERSRVEERELQAATAIQKVMRRDAEMEQSLELLRRARQTIKTLEELLDGAE